MGGVGQIYVHTYYAIRAPLAERVVVHLIVNSACSAKPNYVDRKSIQQWILVSHISVLAGPSGVFSVRVDISGCNGTSGNTLDSFRTFVRTALASRPHIRPSAASLKLINCQARCQVRVCSFAALLFVCTPRCGENAIAVEHAGVCTLRRPWMFQQCATQVYHEYMFML